VAQACMATLPSNMPWPVARHSAAAVQHIQVFQQELQAPGLKHTCRAHARPPQPVAESPCCSFVTCRHPLWYVCATMPVLDQQASAAARRRAGDGARRRRVPPRRGGDCAGGQGPRERRARAAAAAPGCAEHGPGTQAAARAGRRVCGWRRPARMWPAARSASGLFGYEQNGLFLRAGVSVELS